MGKQFPKLKDSINEDYGDGHEDGEDDRSDFEDLLNQLAALNSRKAFLLENTCTIGFVMMVVVVIMF